MRADRPLPRAAWKLTCALLVPWCLGVAGWNALRPGEVSPPPAWSQELPREWEGRPLRPLALSEVEARFARRFPGSLARLTDGQQVLVLRTVLQPTRMLHPAADCYRGLGFTILAPRLEQDAAQQLWRCFEVERGGRRQRVCERIVDADGQGFTDTSAWFWAALLGETRGPWQAVTVARPL